MITQSETSSPPVRRYRGAFRFAALVSAMLLAAGLLFNIGLVRSHANSIRGVEPNVVYGIQRLLDGQTLYSDPDHAPFAVIQYTPLYYLAAAALDGALGLEPRTQVYEIYVAGRALSLICGLAVTALVYIACRRFGRERSESLIAAALSFLLAVPWYTLVRPDGFLGLFGIATIVVMCQALAAPADDPGQSRRMLLVGALSMLALLSKQSGVLFGAVAILQLLLMRRYRSVGWLVVGAGVTTAIVALAGGSRLPLSLEIIFSNIVDGVNNGTNHWLAIERAYTPLVVQNWPLLLAATIACIHVLRHMHAEAARRPSITARFLALTYIATMGFALVSSLKVGSAINYYSESLIVGVLLVVSCAGAFGALARRLHVATPLLAVLLVVPAVIQVIRTHYELREHLTASDLQAAYRPVTDFLRDQLASDPDGLVLTMIIRSLNLPLFDRIIVPHPDVSNLTYPLGTQDFRDLRRLVNDGTIRYVIAGRPLTAPLRVYGAVFTQLHQVATFNGMRIYSTQPGE